MSNAFNFQLTDMPENMADLRLIIKDDCEAVHGAVTEAAPQVFLKYFFVNTKTGEKSGEMLATVKLG